MLTTTGEVKVLDFGFAKIEMDETELVRVVELLSLGQPDDGPTAISQEPLFRLLGTPPEHKRRVVCETSHPIPRNEMIKEAVDVTGPTESTT
jgi:hypothetical protein